MAQAGCRNLVGFIFWCIAGRQHGVNQRVSRYRRTGRMNSPGSGHGTHRGGNGGRDGGCACSHSYGTRCTRASAQRGGRQAYVPRRAPMRRMGRVELQGKPCSMAAENHEVGFLCVPPGAGEKAWRGPPRSAKTMRNDPRVINKCGQAGRPSDWRGNRGETRQVARGRLVRGWLSGRKNHSRWARIQARGSCSPVARIGYSSGARTASVNGIGQEPAGEERTAILSRAPDRTTGPAGRELTTPAVARRWTAARNRFWPTGRRRWRATH